MKRKIFTLIVGLMLTLTSLAQKTVAVYVTSSEGITSETKKVLGSELVAAITKTADYVAVERTADFMAQVAKEQNNYNIDDAALYNLGRKFGASNVCVADVAKFGDEYYIVARLLDIKTSKVWKTAKKYSTLSSLKELVDTSEALANDLFGNKKEFSTYAYGDNRNNHSFITKIENRETYTKVTMKYVVTSYEEQIGILRTTYVEDLTSGDKYYLTNTSNVNIIDDNNKKYKTTKPGVVEYALFFERLSDDATNIMIIEPGGREYKDIILKQYGEKNLYVFEDNADKVYEEWQQQQKEKFENKKYSTYAYGDVKEDQGYITRIENRDTNTKVTIKYLSTKKQNLGVERDTYIEDLATHEKYYLQDAYNINITEKKEVGGK